MPLDPYFTSKAKPKQGKLNRYGKPKPEPPFESVEMQLGRSDHRLGAQQNNNPFPENGHHPSDASEWSRGWLAEKSVEVNNQLIGAQLAFPKRFKKCPRTSEQKRPFTVKRLDER